MAYLTNPETKLASGMISRPNLSLAKEISMVAIIFAAASHTLASAKAWPGHILKESMGCERMPAQKLCSWYSPPSESEHNITGINVCRTLLRHLHISLWIESLRIGIYVWVLSHPPVIHTCQSERMRDVPSYSPNIGNHHGAIRYIITSEHVVRIQPMGHP